MVEEKWVLVRESDKKITNQPPLEGRVVSSYARNHATAEFGILQCAILILFDLDGFFGVFIFKPVLVFCVQTLDLGFPSLPSLGCGVVECRCTNGGILLWS